MVDRQLLERIDACRPGSDDLHDPALAPLADELAESRAKRDLYDRVQALDGAIGEALEDVPVPVGLSERLLARLAAEQVVSAVESAKPPAEILEAAPSPATDGASRRTWLYWSLGLTAAASIAGIVATMGWLRPILTADNIRAQVLQYNEEPLASAPVERGYPEGYPLSRHVYRLPHTTWRPVYGFLHRSDLNGVAYDLMLRGTSATLYVVPTRVSHFPAAPPARIGTATGNLAVAAWQENGLLYVLVVQGDERAYQSFIRRPTTA